MPKYVVAVKEAVLAYYEVEADTLDDARESWRDGECVSTGDRLDAESISAQEIDEDDGYCFMPVAAAVPAKIARAVLSPSPSDSDLIAARELKEQVYQHVFELLDSIPDNEGGFDGMTAGRIATETANQFEASYTRHARFS